VGVGDERPAQAAQTAQISTDHVMARTSHANADEPMEAQVLQSMRECGAGSS
jgi:hypothetical protein